MSASPVSPTAPPDRTRVAPIWHTIVFVVGTIGLSFGQAHQSPKISTMKLPTRVPLYLAMMVFELLMLGYVWIGVRLAGRHLRDVIGGKWSRAIDFWRDVVIALAFWIVVLGMLVVVRVLLGTNPAGTEAVRMLIPRTSAEMAVWVLLAVTAGFCEETVFRGYLQRQCLALSGRDEFAVALQALLFGSAHLYQGWKNAVAITIYGGLFGALAAWRKSVRPGMIQHASQDTFSGIVGSLAARHHYL
ncbi:MAG TPA: type II CAAX endopeptidase family protein [Candidatus Cybelea sp.]|nr:type II CAAX endopeptidase family protein [Candidatus Cybelea sp.]